MEVTRYWPNVKEHILRHAAAADLTLSEKTLLVLRLMVESNTRLKTADLRQDVAQNWIDRRLREVRQTGLPFDVIRGYWQYLPNKEWEGPYSVKRKFTKKLKRQIFRRDDHTCHWCKKMFLAKHLTLDHYPIPKSKGGSDTPDNLVTSCFPCNHDKSDSYPLDGRGLPTNEISTLPFID